MSAPSDLSPVPAVGFSLTAPPATVTYANPAPFGNTKEIIILNTDTTEGIYFRFVSNPTVQATGSFQVGSGVDLPQAGDMIAIGGVFLTAVNGPAGVGQFSVDSGTQGGIALEIAAAITSVPNGLTGIVTPGTIQGGLIPLIAVPVGTAGNLIGLGTTALARLTPSGGALTGGVGTALVPADVAAGNSTFIPAGAAITLAIGPEGYRQVIRASWGVDGGSFIYLVFNPSGIAPVTVNITYVNGPGGGGSVN